LVEILIPDLKGKLTTAEFVAKMLEKQGSEANSSLKICQESRKFGCALDTEACKQITSAHDWCMKSFEAKNVSYANLQEAHDELVDDWENTTSALEQCSAESLKLAKQLEEEVATVKRLEKQVSDQRQEHERKLSVCENKVGSLQTVIDSVHDDLVCLGGSRNCSFEAGKYWCVPRFFTRSMCLMEALAGHEVFKIPLCGLLGDRTISHLNWRQFIKDNPIVAVVLIFTMIFASIGFVTTFVIILWCVVIYRRRRGSMNIPQSSAGKGSSEV